MGDSHGKQTLKASLVFVHGVTCQIIGPVLQVIGIFIYEKTSGSSGKTIYD